MLRVTACIFTVLLYASIAYAAGICPDCQAKYTTCSWNCTTSSNGSNQPICGVFLTAKQDALNMTPDPASFEVSPSQCDAQCYLSNLGELKQLTKYVNEYSQTVAPECNKAWLTQQALDYNTYNQSGMFSGSSMGSVPQWLQDEINWIAAHPVDPNIVNAATTACAVCNKSGIAGAAYFASNPWPYQSTGVYDALPIPSPLSAPGPLMGPAMAPAPVAVPSAVTPIFSVPPPIASPPPPRPPSSALSLSLPAATAVVTLTLSAIIAMVV